MKQIHAAENRVRCPLQYFSRASLERVIATPLKEKEEKAKQGRESRQKPNTRTEHTRWRKGVTRRTRVRATAVPIPEADTLRLITVVIREQLKEREKGAWDAGHLTNHLPR